MSSKIFIGVDGGGTSTRALAINSSGKPIATGQAAGSNPNNIGFPQAAKNILDAIAQTHLTLDANTSLCLGIAGLANETQRQTLRRALLTAQPNLAPTKLALTHDLEIAHYAAFQNKPGIILIAGTGSACYAKNALGQTFRASGRDFDYDDPGSGYALGKRAIDTQLLPPADSRPSIAALAPRVIELATQGNLKALEILRIESENLIQLAQRVHADFAQTERSLTIALSGSILETESLYRQTVLSALQSALPTVSITKLTLTPVQAAAQLAKSSAEL